jgi:hypothetical protein
VTVTSIEFFKFQFKTAVTAPAKVSVSRCLLQIDTGGGDRTVHSGHYRRRRRREFLDFMNQLVSIYPGKELHLVLDNLNTHQPKQNRWLKTARTLSSLSRLVSKLMTIQIMWDES